ncbi:MAG: hypothetical protein ABFE13_12400 [Phycisphaerales bacterium]
MRRVSVLMTLLAVSGCTTFPIPGTLGDPRNAGSYGYHPLDPLPIKLGTSDLKPLEMLPDETIRIAVGSISGDGGISFGPATVGVQGKNYVVVLDYIKFSTDSFPVTLSQPDTRGARTATLAATLSEANAIVPVYIGVGLRLTASIVVQKGSVDLSSLFALGVAAKAERISGTVVIQTLGVSGPEISGLIPMPGEISEATMQNAILALASIRAKMYDAKTTISPRVVGVYNTLGGGEATINGFISSILEHPITFPK